MTSPPPTSIHSLPPELIDLIFDHLHPESEYGNRKNERYLAAGALVCRSWRDPASSRLYIHLNILSDREAGRMAQNGVLKRYPRRFLRFNWIVQGWSDVKSIMRSSAGLKELSLGRDCQSTPMSLFTLPELSSLEVLILNAWLSLSSPPSAFTFRLRHLETHLSSYNARTVRIIANVSSSDPGRHLTSFGLLEVPDDPASLSLLHPLAATLESLILPVLWDYPTLHGPFVTTLKTFLPLLTSLARLSLGFGTSPQIFPSIGGTLSGILDAIHAPVTRLDLRFSLHDVQTYALFDMLDERLLSWPGLETLRILRFSSLETGDLLQCREQWAKFEGALSQKNVRLVPGGPVF